jgi:hypothetical protein
MHTVRREIVVPPLFTVRNNRRACGIKSLNRVSNRFFIETIELGILAVAFCDSLERTLTGLGKLPIGSVSMVIAEGLAILIAV